MHLWNRWRSPCRQRGRARPRDGQVKSTGAASVPEVMRNLSKSVGGGNECASY